MIKKRAPILCVWMFCFFILLACNTEEKEIGLFLYNQEDLFIKNLSTKMEEKSTPFFSMRTYNARNSQLIQNENIEEMIKEKGKLFIINPVDRLGVYSIIKKLKKEDRPIIFFNREPLKRDLHLWDKVYYVGSQAQQSGQMQAEMVINLFGGDPYNLNQFDLNKDGIIQAVIMKGERGHQDAELRTSELLATFKNNRFKVEVLTLEVANFELNEAYKKMNRIYKTYGENIEVILCNNDAMAIGAILKLKELGAFRDDNENGKIDSGDSSWIPILGIDGVSEAQKLIVEGSLFGTVLSDSTSMANAITELSRILLSDGDISTFSYPISEEKYIWIDYKPLSREQIILQKGM